MLLIDYCEKQGICKRGSSIYHPEGDEEAERTMHTFKIQIAMSILEERRIAEQIDQVWLMK